MRRKRRRTQRESIAMPGMPSPQQRMKYSAESMAGSMMENHPKMRKIRDAIMSEVMKAGEKAISKKMSGKAKGSSHADEMM